MTEFILKGGQDRSRIPHISIGKILFESVNKFGNRVAIIDVETEKSITFSEILLRSTKLAVVLKRLGLKRNDTIILITDFNFDFCVTYLACLFNGHTVYFLNPNNTKFELRQYLDQTSAKIVFSCEQSAENILSLQSEYSNLETVLVLNPKSKTNLLGIDDLIKDQVVENFEPDSLDPEDTNAVVIFSSGTTGLPKAVALTHANIRMCLLQTCTYYSGTTEEDVLINVTPTYHIAGSIMLFKTLFVGVKMVTLTKFVPEVFLSAAQKYEVTKMFLVPQLVDFMLNSPLVAKFDLSKIRILLIASAPCSEELLNKLHNKFPQAELNHMYGLTETSGCITQNRLNRCLNSVGVIFPCNAAKVVDLQTGEALGPNKPGEICFKGESVVKKYYNLENSAKVFDANGFLRSGDVAYYDENGFIYIVDRIKDIIKYKGFQVSPTEIENVLSLHPAVEEVGVIGVPDERAGEVPCAFIVKKGHIEVTQKEIVDFVAEKLNPHKHLRGGIMFVREIPKNSMMKKDRNAMKTIWKQTKIRQLQC